MDEPKLTITVQGSIIDHLGVQMYQSPPAAVAELIANAWDADAQNVIIKIPESFLPNSTIEIIDDGNGMTSKECQDHFLKVGACRRTAGREFSESLKRPVLGKKGIGKFAGFGIATEITIDTTSKKNGERTVFVLNNEELRNETMDNKSVRVIKYIPSSLEGEKSHGTHIILSNLNNKKKIMLQQFKESIARKFMLQSGSSPFSIMINDDPLPDGFELNPEFDFPSAYDITEYPTGLTITEDGWGNERLQNGKAIKWRFMFLKMPISDEELRGISVFCRGKLAQKPFNFNLTGGLGGQQGIEYLTGRVIADYIDDLPIDLIAPERQRIDWDNDETEPLKLWGQERIKSLIKIWKERRGKKRIDAINLKIAPFTARLERLPSHERNTVKRALYKIAEIPTLEDEQLTSLSESILTAWEGGRLKDLISEISDSQDSTAEKMLSLLLEAQVLGALNAAEVVKTKLEAVSMLETAIKRKTLENKLRDYIAENPDFLDPKWETYKKETSLKYILDEAEKSSKRDSSEISSGKRIDLLFRGGNTFLVIEFMRPGLVTDRDHLERLEQYCDYIKNAISSRTEIGISQVIGLFVGDNLGGNPSIISKVENLKKLGITSETWEDLLANSKHSWKDFLDILKTKAPNDERLAKIG